MRLDKVTEAIAHFIGVFGITTEGDRLRLDYKEFRDPAHADPDQPELPNVNVRSESPYELNPYVPETLYRPVEPDIVTLRATSQVEFWPPEIRVPVADIGSPSPYHRELDLFKSPAPTAVSAKPLLDPPGSIVVNARQIVELNDNDYVGTGGHGLLFQPIDFHYGSQMAALLDGAASVSPFADLDRPTTPDEIGDFILANAAAIESYVPPPDTEDTDIFVVSQPVIEGIYVNGAIASEAPALPDHLPGSGQPEATPQDEPQDSVVINVTEADIPNSVTLEAGANLLVNTALVNNSGLGASVFAVLGDHVEVNAIVQVNAWSDSDLIGSSLADWNLAASGTTQSFNIGVFERVDPAATGGAAEGSPPDDFPQHWQVTSIEGDLIFLNWTEQYSFVTDNDVHMLAASGAETIVTTGANTVLNDFSFEDLGLYYDLIIVGGNIYDANIITQTNILFDNDFLAGVNGFETSGQGSISTSGNLLWNSAGIVNIGGADRFEPLPTQYQETAGNLAAGGTEISDGVLQDTAFAGLAGLRVLYVSGSIYDLQYIKQVNVLGDADQVALAETTLVENLPDAEWAISTGSNALVNMASIIDLDTYGGTSYLGGESYSDEILIQAELIAPDADLGHQDPDALANEAIAFLDDMPDATGMQDMQPDYHGTDAPPVDVMQTMLS